MGKLRLVNRDFGLVFWLHVIVIAVAWSSPFWAVWWAVALGVLAYYCQQLIFGGCLLTKLELRDVPSFWHHYLSKLSWYKLSVRSTLVIVDGVAPGIVLVLALARALAR